MADQDAGFVDYGFLDAAAAATFGVHKRQIQPDAQGAVNWIAGLHTEFGKPSTLLRVYWYDAAFPPDDKRGDGQRRYFHAIERTPGLKLRLGQLRTREPAWHYAFKQALAEHGVDEEAFAKSFQLKPEVTQKGVDTLITLDIVRLAQKAAYTTGVVIAGDQDLAEPIRAAQDEGRRMILAVPRRAGVAPELRRLADQVITIDDETLRSLVRVNER